MAVSRSILTQQAVVNGLTQFALLLVCAASAAAQPTGITLDAALPAQLAGCLPADELSANYRRALAAYGGKDPAKAQLPLHVEVRSQPGFEPDSTLLQIVAFAPGREIGARELPVRGADCAALPEALGVVLALLAHDAPAAAETPAASSAVASGAAPQAEHVTIGAGAAAFIGVLPSAAVALQLQAATAGERLSLRLKAGMLWPQRHALAEGFIEARSYELSLEACSGLRLPSWPRLALRVCLGPRLGLMDARGRGFGIQNQSTRKFLMYLGLMPEAALRLAGATWLQLGAGVAITVVRPRFSVGLDRGQKTVELSDPAVLRSELSLSVVQIF